MKMTGGGSDRGQGGVGFSLAALFSTHPSLDKRIAQLEKIQRELGEVGPADPRGLR
jgi:Zn-dependent protease with chaperone function